MPANDKNLIQMIMCAALSRLEFGEVVYEAGGTHGPRVQEEAQLVLVHAGHAEIQVDAATRHVPPGHCILLLPGRHEYFRFAPSTHTRHSWCSVRFADGAKLYQGLTEASIVARTSAALDSVVRLGLVTQAGPTAAHRAMLECLGRAALLEYLAHLEHANEANRFDFPEQLVHVLTHVHMHLGDKLDLNKLAELGHATPATMVRLFKRHLGDTRMRVVWALRVERAAALLRETGASVAAVAWQLGYKSPAHFCRAFKSAHGVTPTTYRKRARPADNTTADNPPREGP